MLALYRYQVIFLKRKLFIEPQNVHYASPGNKLGEEPEQFVNDGAYSRSGISVVEIGHSAGSMR